MKIGSGSWRICPGKFGGGVGVDMVCGVCDESDGNKVIIAVQTG